MKMKQRTTQTKKQGHSREEARLPDNSEGFLFAMDDDSFPEQLLVPEDAGVRAAALDTSRSLLVQAPAGAGKTSLLTQRYLALLPTVEQPEQILAITFTRMATAEMRGRVLQALKAARLAPDAVPGEPVEHALAREALQHAEAMGWKLLEQPGRLDIQSIDALALRIAHGQPMLARLGGALSPSENAGPLYAAAARRTMAQLDKSTASEGSLQQALRYLLQHRDNHLTKLESLIAGALATRDAWLTALPIAGNGGRDWDQVRADLERPFAEENAHVLGKLHKTFASAPLVAAELLSICNYAGSMLQGGGLTDVDSPYRPKADGPDLRTLRELKTQPGSEPLKREAWLCIAEFLFTQGGTWRKEFNKTCGIPAGGSGPGKAEREGWKTRTKACAAALQQPPLGSLLLGLVSRLRALPAPGYSEQQWQTLRAIFTVLRYATVQLRLVFAESNTVDFTEIALAAETVLQDPDGMRGLLESEHKQHLLIDEFQDTSRTQYRLIAHLIREWSPGDGRSVFLVGDPLQSIYSFRQAEVALFHQTRDHGLPCGTRRHPCHPLQLTHNFRSHGRLVDQLNEWFGAMWSGEAERGPDADSFVPAKAWPLPSDEDWSSAESGEYLQLHPVFYDKESGSVAEARAKEASAVLLTVQAELRHMQAAIERNEAEYRIAILFRSRSHLAHILPALRAAGIPYRGVELEPLGEQTEVRDLHLLLRALLHPADRIAWLSVLRAPWCGLTLLDLHRLTGDDDKALLRQTLRERIAACLAENASLSQDGIARLTRVWLVLQDALRTRYTAGNTLSLSQWLERTWTALGGPACLQGSGHDNADAYFRLLDEVAPSGLAIAEAISPQSDFAVRLNRLYAAPDPNTNDHFGVQIMSIHKAKGLGFEAVLLPGLERKARQDAGELLYFLQRTRQATPEEIAQGIDPSELLVCPVGANEGTDGPAAATADWIKSLESRQAAAERKRLFYVACTRARIRLHLFGCVISKDGELSKPDSSSLLGAAWAALGPRFGALYASSSQASRSPQDAHVSATFSLAASADNTAAASSVREPLQLQMSDAAVPVNRLDRLPTDFALQPWAEDIPFVLPLQATAPLYTRAEGSLAARARGTAMHALLQQLSALFKQAEEDPERVTQATWRPLLLQSATHNLRRNAYPSAGLKTTASTLVSQAIAVSKTAVGEWLFHPYEFSLSEASWQTADAGGTPQTIRVDQCFIGPNPPGTAEIAEQESLWLIDFKSAFGATVPEASGTDRAALQAWLTEQKELYRPQLEAYAGIVSEQVQTAAGKLLPLRFALYFPEILELLTW
jgi:ATP-dependent helicase/nuclease subunit A